MRFNPAAFNRFLGPGGPVTQELAWRRAFSCPCFNPASGATLPNCPVCRGKGRIWSDEVTGNAGFTNQAPGKSFAQFGVWEPGDALLTIPETSPFYVAGWYDRFRGLNSSSPFSYNLTRGDNDILYGTVQSITRVFWLGTDQTTIIEGGIPTVGSDGSLTWASGEPPAGKQYSLTGVKFDEYFVFRTLTSDRNVGVNGLPLRLQLRVFDLAGR